jgi:uncharacterized protein (TIGR02646 family)
MIRLNKGAAPGVLVANAAAWTQAYLAYTQNNQAPPPSIAFRYRHPEIKAALLAETHEKCSYCESKNRHVSPGETDHIAPRSKRPDLVFAWDNLTYTCDECNHAKGAYYNIAEPLINPYSDDPNNHFQFAGPLICHLPGDPIGRRSTRILRLNRTSLFERRRERLEGLLPLIDQWSQLPMGDDKELIRHEIMDEAKEDKEYSAAVKSFLDDLEIE